LYWATDKTVSFHPLFKNEIGPRQRSISFPWPETEILTRGVTDGNRKLHLPIWVSDPKGNSTGTVQTVMVNNRGKPSYRKMISLPSRPLQSDMVLTGKGTPLLLIYHREGVFLFTISEIGDQKIDSLPPKSIRLIIPNQQEEIIDTRFGSDEEHGVVVHVLSRQNKNVFSTTFSHTGKPLGRNELHHFPEDIATVSLILNGQSPTVLGKTKTGLGLWNNGTWTPIQEKITENQIYINPNETSHTLYFLKEGLIQQVTLKEPQSQ
jgi:hypothetical protein